jgi:TRAP-type C4-dicarboxylate transport system substrate-binding protein
MNTKKKMIALAFAVVLILTSAAGCGAGSSSDSAAENASDSAAGEVAEGAAGDDAEVYAFRIDDPNPNTAICSIILDEWSAWLDEKSDGRIRMEIFHNAALGNIADCVSNCLAGISDGFWSAQLLYTGSFPVGECISLPMMNVRNAEVGTAVQMEILRTTDYFDKEYQNLHPLVIHTASTMPLGINTGKEVSSMADLKGMKIRAVGGVASDFVSAIGASPVTISSNEGYEALEKKIVSAYLYDWDKIYTSKLLEQTTSVLNCRLYVSPMFLVLNQGKYNELPDDLKAIVDESADFFISRLGEGYVNYVNILTDEAADRGIPITEFNDEMRAEWKEAAESIHRNWIETMNDKGYDGQAIYDLTLSLIEKYNQIYDYDA